MLVLHGEDPMPSAAHPRPDGAADGRHACRVMAMDGPSEWRLGVRVLELNCVAYSHILAPVAVCRGHAAYETTSSSLGPSTKLWGHSQSHMRHDTPITGCESSNQEKLALGSAVMLLARLAITVSKKKHSASQKKPKLIAIDS